MLALAIAGATIWWLRARHFESTDDAFVAARSFSVAPKVAGYLAEVDVTDNQHVPVGAVLARIDDRDYRVAKEQAEAQLAAAQANVAGLDAQIEGQRTEVARAQAGVKQVQAAVSLAQENAGRADKLLQSGNTTVAAQQQTTSQLQQAQANLIAEQKAVDTTDQQIRVLEAQRSGAIANSAGALAQRDRSALDLGYSAIIAAQPGRLVSLSAAKGQYVVPGQSLAMFVPDEVWITANFKETQIADMRPGQPVDVSIDAYPNIDFYGRVDSIQSGSGTAFSLLPAENATGNYVKVVQRVPVKIVLDHVPEGVVLGPGMSAVPKVRVR